MKIDAHQHFWKYDGNEYGWIDDKMSILKKDHLPKQLQPILKENGMDGSIAVQARQSLEETQWLLDLADEHSFIKGVVGWLDLRSDELVEQLETFAPHPKLVGVRHVVQDEPDGFILDNKFLRGIERLPDYNLAYDILIFPHHLPDTIKFVKQFPYHRFILDHIAKPIIRENILSPWDQYIKQLGAFPNVYCKISGLVTEADRQNWTIIDFAPYLDIILNSFGINRVLFGSDWPVCTVAATYEQVIEIVDSYLKKQHFSNKEKAAFWGGNAKSIYDLK